MRVPLATYRLQLNREFTFVQAAAIVPYLAGLGITHCYLSPCPKARAGSMHGYDIVDHSCFNPEIGTTEDFDRLSSTVHGHGMGLILDIVSNHMGVMGGDNAWWLDVLENGQASVYANYFDIDWDPPNDDLKRKVLIPALHDHYGAVLESGELQLAFRSGQFVLTYRNHIFPLDPRGYPRILERCLSDAAHLGDLHADFLEFQSLITAFGHLPARKDISNERIIERNRDKEILKRRLFELCAKAPEIKSCIEENVKQINGDPSDPSSFETLHKLIKSQSFRLANWRVASDDINYRRFFDTNDLAGICVENPAVFEATHRFVLNLIAEGKVDGLRIDHPDGLYEPQQYFERLKSSIAAATGDMRYVIIEKILTGSEHLPLNWPVQGTTGYDFTNLVNALFVDHSGLARFDRIYRHFLQDEIDLDDLEYSCRKLIMRVALASELNVLANQLNHIALSRRRTCDFTLNSLRQALAEVAANFPVYRTYVNANSVLDRDIIYIHKAVAAAKVRSQTADASILDFVETVLNTHMAVNQNLSYQNAVHNFAMKFQQFTSPVMAKGIEDTAFYRYNRLTSLNEVGSDLHRFGISKDEFHLANELKKRDWPHSMLATSTHDSKRSEDVRARINVLSEIPAEWRLHLREWKRANACHKIEVNGNPAPFPNEEYLLYQTLLGAWPFEPFNNADEVDAFRLRIEQYMLKAAREAKQNTSWINRNEPYEEALTWFIGKLLEQSSRNEFLSDFVPFQQRIARMGVWNSISQTLLKLTCPGVPDIYQGNEIWDLSLVDPDNRRAVDYERRQQQFEDVQRSSENLGRLNHCLLQCPEDGRVKLYVIWKTLCLRQQQPALFQDGNYRPIEVLGENAEHVVAFSRTHGGMTAIVVVPRLIASLLSGSDSPPVGEKVWGNTNFTFPGLARRYHNIFTGETLTVDEAVGIFSSPMSQILADFPVAVLTATP
jgi:(1->4)-alpha-D-glucan 1-alpha-D-glucosylmutase